MARLGFELPAEFDELAAGSYFAQVSIEQLDLIADLDVLIWVASEEALAEVELYQSLPLVTEGRVIYVGEDDPLYEALSFSTVLSLPYVIENLTPRIAVAIDGDPATTTEG